MITLRQRDSIAADEWYYPLNGDMTPDNTAGKSGKTAYFQCLKNPKHIFDRKVYKTLDKNDKHVECPFCTGKRVASGENDFLTLCPEAVALWDYEKNLIDPRTLHANARYKAHFKCKNGHIFQLPVHSFTKAPSCKECKLHANSIVAHMPEVIHWWDYEKNINDIPESHYKNEGTKVWWKYPKYNYSWHAEIASRAASKLQCPCCDLGIAFKEGVNDALTRCPEIGLNWDYESNGDLKPNKIFITDKRVKVEIYWICHVCNYHWSTKSINTRIYFENGIAKLRKCPSCAGKEADENTDNIMVTHPNIASEYIEELNDIPVTNIRYGSSKKRVWKCKKCKQIIVTSPAERTRKGGAGGCMYCSGKTSFKALYSELMNEWKHISNLLLTNPDYVLPSATKEVWWKCSKCKRSYTNTIRDKVRIYKSNKESCPFCKGYRRKKRRYI